MAISKAKYELYKFWILPPRPWNIQNTLGVGTRKEKKTIVNQKIELEFRCVPGTYTQRIDALFLNFLYRTKY